MCMRHAKHWSDRTGPFEGFSESERQALRKEWADLAELRRIPETLAQARRFAAAGFGSAFWVDASHTQWVWQPANLSERRGPHRAPRGGRTA